jgi:hypothetical protein
VREVFAPVLLYLNGHVVHKPQWIRTQQLFYFNKIDEVFQEGMLQRQLRLLQNIILIKGEKFSEHLVLVFQK